MYQQIDLSEEYKMNDFMACLRLCLVVPQLGYGLLWFGIHSYVRSSAIPMSQTIDSSLGLTH